MVQGSPPVSIRIASTRCWDTDARTRGVDFSAPTGTPIMAAGDGVIERASRWGTFGNYVRIRHNGTWKTAYAHLSKYGRGIKSGVRVKQGQIIGYVGANRPGDRTPPAL